MRSPPISPVTARARITTVWASSTSPIATRASKPTVSDPGAAAVPAATPTSPPEATLRSPNAAERLASTRYCGRVGTGTLSSARV